MGECGILTIMTPKTMTCTKCQKRKRTGVFGPNGKGRLRPECRVCHAERKRLEYHLESPKQRAQRVARSRRYQESEKAKRTAYRWRTTTVMGYANKKLTTIRANSKKRGLKVTITPKYLRNMLAKQEGLCTITGRELLMVTDTNNLDSLSVDRIDCSKGYIRGNVQLLTRQANSAKMTGTGEELLEFCRDVVRTIGGGEL